MGADAGQTKHTLCRRRRIGRGGGVTGEGEGLETKTMLGPGESKTTIERGHLGTLRSKILEVKHEMESCRDPGLIRFSFFVIIV